MPTGRVQNKVALVTGGGSGIGRATALLLATEGARVVAADIDPIAADHTASAINARGGKAEAVELDVTEESMWVSAMGKVVAGHCQLDILVNNAGISFAKPVAEMTLAEWRRVLAVNLDGVFLGTRHAIAAMKGNGGSFVNVSSAAGCTPYPEASAYGASKAAVRHFSKIAAIECADRRTGIRVNLVTPGGVKTPMWETMDFFKDLVARHGSEDQAFAALEGAAPSRAFFAADEVARTILFLASDESAHMTGVEIVLGRGHIG